MTTIINVDTCECEFEYETKILLKRCRTHTTVDQVLAHNRSFNLRATRKDEIDEDKRKEKLKPQFRRR